jgi:hypothetical protein
LRHFSEASSCGTEYLRDEQIMRSYNLLESFLLAIDYQPNDHAIYTKLSNMENEKSLTLARETTSSPKQWEMLFLKVTN